MPEEFCIDTLFDEILARLVPTVESNGRLLQEPLRGGEAERIVQQHLTSAEQRFAMGRLAKENDWTPREGMGYLRRLVKNPAQRGLRNVVATIYRRLGEDTDARRQFHASLLVRRRVFSMLEQVCLLQIAQGYHTPQGTL